MYTLEQLQQKNLKELKEIGWQLNVLPAGDRRCRKNWIDALISKNPPLLQLLEASLVAEVEAVHEAIEPVGPFNGLQSAIDALIAAGGARVLAVGDRVAAADGVALTKTSDDSFFFEAAKTSPGVSSEAIEVQAQEPIETSPAAEVEPVQEAIEVQAQEPIEQVTKICNVDYLDCPKCGTVQGLYAVCPGQETIWETHCTRCDYLEPCIRHPFEDVRPFEVDRVKEPPIESKFGRIIYPKAAAKPIAPDANFNDEQPPNRGDGKGRVEPELLKSAIASAAKNSPAVKSKSTAHQLLELFKSAAHIIPDSPADEEVTESAIGQTEVGQKLDGSWTEVGQLTGCTLSAEFLARYSPPQPEIIHFQCDADGQLSLLHFTVEPTNEPPDPDDFPSIDAFKEAMARWDAENPEPLTVSVDSMCEWTPVPDEWYEPIAQISPQKAPSMREVMESSQPIECSNTCDFSIPTFDAWCDRPNRQTDSDEPPDTGIFARLPKPKPPSFPPMIVGKCDRTNRIRKFARGAILAIGRAPPGGDAM